MDYALRFEDSKSSPSVHCAKYGWNVCNQCCTLFWSFSGNFSCLRVPILSLWVLSTRFFVADKKFSRPHVPLSGAASFHCEERFRKFRARVDETCNRSKRACDLSCKKTSLSMILTFLKNDFFACVSDCIIIAGQDYDDSIR